MNAVIVIIVAIVLSCQLEDISSHQKQIKDLLQQIRRNGLTPDERAQEDADQAQNAKTWRFAAGVLVTLCVIVYLAAHYQGRI